MKNCFLYFAILFLFFLKPDFAYTRVYNLSEVHALTASREVFEYPDYFLIKEDPRVAIVDLMNFQHVQAALPVPEVPYDRLSQFGTWIHDPNDNTCLNTRGKVLVRESKEPVTLAGNGCAVQSGLWNDPYTANKLILALDVQVDHFVPLKNAYMTGAFEWSPNKRCLYANYLGNDFHLLAVSGVENIKKGDNTPSGYMPPNKNYACTYLKHWLQVKVIWALRITPDEFNAIQREFKASQCDRSEFKMTAAELTVQRRFMDENKELCRL